MFRFIKGKSPWAVGGVATVLFAGVAVAVIIGTARINNNQAETPQMAAAPVENIGVAVVDQFTSCSDVSLVFEEVSSTSLFSGTVMDYSAPDPLGGYPETFVSFSEFDICVGNQLTAPNLADVMVTTENQVSEELVGCPDPTEEAAGDTTCGAGEGELLGVTGIELIPEAGGCLGPAVWTPGGDPGLDLSGSIGPLASGAVCRFGVVIGWLPDDPVVSTDTVEFDLVFTADDGT